MKFMKTLGGGEKKTNKQQTNLEDKVWQEPSPCPQQSVAAVGVWFWFPGLLCPLLVNLVESVVGCLLLLNCWLKTVALKAEQSSTSVSSGA